MATATPTRIYRVDHKDGSKPPRYVRTTVPSRAKAHVADDTLSVRVATHDDVADDLVANGRKVEDPAEEAQLPLPEGGGHAE